MAGIEHVALFNVQTEICHLLKVEHDSVSNWGNQDGMLPCEREIAALSGCFFDYSSAFRRAVFASSDTIVLTAGLDEGFEILHVLENTGEYMSRGTDGVSEKNTSLVSALKFVEMISLRQTLLVVGYESGHVRLFLKLSFSICTKDTLFAEHRFQTTRVNDIALQRRGGEPDIVILYRHQLAIIDGSGIVKAKLSHQESFDLQCKKRDLPDQHCRGIACLGNCIPCAYDHLVSPTRGGDVMEPAYMYLVVGDHPMIGVYSTAGSQRPFLSVANVATKVATNFSKAVVSMVSSFWGGTSNTSAPKPRHLQHSTDNEAQTGLLLPAPSLPMSFGLSDPKREIEEVVLSPCGTLAAATDNLGRVLLIDIRIATIVRVWKGYRDARCYWVTTDPPSPVEAENSHELSESMLKRKGVHQLCIHARRRGLLEVWNVPLGTRAIAFNVGVGALLFRYYLDQKRNVIVIRPNGKVYMLVLPHSCALSDSMSSHLRQRHVLAAFTAFLDSITVTTEKDAISTTYVASMLTGLKSPLFLLQALHIIFSKGHCPHKIRETILELLFERIDTFLSIHKELAGPHANTCDEDLEEYIDSSDVMKLQLWYSLRCRQHNAYQRLRSMLNIERNPISFQPKTSTVADWIVSFLQLEESPFPREELFLPQRVQTESESDEQDRELSISEEADSSDSNNDHDDDSSPSNLRKPAPSPLQLMSSLFLSVQVAQNQPSSSPSEDLPFVNLNRQRLSDSQSKSDDSTCTKLQAHDVQLTSFSAVLEPCGMPSSPQDLMSYDLGAFPGVLFDIAKSSIDHDRYAAADLIFGSLYYNAVETADSQFIVDILQEMGLSCIAGVHFWLLWMLNVPLNIICSQTFSDRAVSALNGLLTYLPHRKPACQHDTEADTDCFLSSSADRFIEVVLSSNTSFIHKLTVLTLLGNVFLKVSAYLLSRSIIQLALESASIKISFVENSSYPRPIRDVAMIFVSIGAMPDDWNKPMTSSLLQNAAFPHFQMIWRLAEMITVICSTSLRHCTSYPTSSEIWYTACFLELQRKWKQCPFNCDALVRSFHFAEKIRSIILRRCIILHAWKSGAKPFFAQLTAQNDKIKKYLKERLCVKHLRASSEQVITICKSWSDLLLLLTEETEEVHQPNDNSRLTFAVDVREELSSSSAKAADLILELVFASCGMSDSSNTSYLEHYDTTVMNSTVTSCTSSTESTPAMDTIDKPQLLLLRSKELIEYHAALTMSLYFIMKYQLKVRALSMFGTERRAILFSPLHITATEVASQENVVEEFTECNVSTAIGSNSPEIEPFQPSCRFETDDDAIATHHDFVSQLLKAVTRRPKQFHHEAFNNLTLLCVRLLKMKESWLQAQVCLSLFASGQDEDASDILHTLHLDSTFVSTLAQVCRGRAALLLSREAKSSHRVALLSNLPSETEQWLTNTQTDALPPHLQVEDVSEDKLTIQATLDIVVTTDQLFTDVSIDATTKLMMRQLLEALGKIQ
eukprot:gene10553-2678_t